MHRVLFLSLLPYVCLTAAPCPSRIAPLPDRSLLLGSGAGPAYRWLVNGAAAESGTRPRVFRPNGGVLTPSREGNLDLKEGAIEFRLSALSDGDGAAYGTSDNILFSYRAPNGDRLIVGQSAASRNVFATSVAGGRSVTASGSMASIRGWLPGRMHSVVVTFSAEERRLRLYVDGIAAASGRGGGEYEPPAATGERFTVGGDLSGSPAPFRIERVRVFSRAVSAPEIRAIREHVTPPADAQVSFDAASLRPGDRVTFESKGCASEPYVHKAAPIGAADPPSSLLAPGATSLDLSVESAQIASCSYSVNALLPYSRMKPFSSGEGSKLHRARLTGLDPDPKRVNEVFVRCSSDPDYALKLKYRARAAGNAAFPRTGNLWGTGQIVGRGLRHASRIGLHLGASFSPSDMRRLRELNPHILILTSINTVENSGVPDDFFLKDTTGSRIEVWPNIYRLNLTKKNVAEYQARFAYQRMLGLDLMVDGCFFDNFFVTQSNLRQDIHGRKVQLDANEDGKEDDPKWLDPTWRDGVFHELRAWRKMMPHALNSGHLPRPATADIMEIFNGDSIGFRTAQVLEKETSFVDLWDLYESWQTSGRRPALMMLESAPHNQIAYGYDYTPLNKIPPSTLEFARSYYPYVRFGLALTLMNDGYFCHEFGDTWHGNDWWYDELDFDLGKPLGPARRAVEFSAARKNLLDSSWTGTETDLEHAPRPLVPGVRYDLQFRARADAPRSITVSTAPRSGALRGYGAGRTLALTPEWKGFAFPFEATDTAPSAQTRFLFGPGRAKVEIQDVRLTERPPDVWRRDYTNGVVLLNGTWERQTVHVGRGYHRLRGREAARHEFIVDDTPEAFTVTAEWRPVTYDSGRWKSKGPFYHNWGAGAHQLDSAGAGAEWKLGICEDDVYTIAAWWPAAPEMSGWSRRVTFEVVDRDQVVASRTLDQSENGDEWHEVASVKLTAGGAPVVRVRNGENRPAIADALWVRSQSRYNDGSPAGTVTLEPMDGIVLGREVAASGTTKAVYAPSDENFPNPERGFYVQRAYRTRDGQPPPPLDAAELRKWRESGMSQLRMYYVLAEFRDAPLSAAMLRRIGDDFAAARSAGIKVIPRFAYNFGPQGQPDAPAERILGHLDQLRPVLRDNSDVIAFMEAGFIGTWGEWHTSTNALFDRIPGVWWQRVNKESRAIVAKLLDVLPPERMIALRYPRHKIDLYGPEPLSELDAFNQSPKARTGAHNDCFLASQNDVGTYTKDMAAEKQFYRRDNLFVPQGGETCSVRPDAQTFTGCENALRQLDELHYNTLNIDYHKGVMEGWRKGGCMGEIERRLGYRFRLLESEATATTAPGGAVNLKFTVANDGFANLYNRRPLELVLRPRSGGKPVRLATGEDARRWMSGRITTVRLQARLPKSMAQGEYDLLLALPDAAPTLRGRTEYAVRFANTDTWEPATGLNRLGHAVRVR